MNIIGKTYNQIVAAVRRKPPAVARAESGRVFVPMREDAYRNYVSEGLTPRKLTGLLHDFDNGILSSGMELFEQIEEKDPHIYSVANTRRLGFTGLPYEIVSAADINKAKDKGRADAAADYCREVLGNIESFDEVLSHLSLAIGRNIAVAELVWDGGELADIVPIPFNRLTYNLTSDSPQLRILTQQERSQGIELVPNKWIVHTPLSPSGHPTRGGLLRLTAACYVAKGFAMKDWLVFLEVFGMPVRIGKYDASATPKDKEELLKMLQLLGSDAVGIFSKAVELELPEAKSRGEAPYEKLAAFVNAETSKAWLGQTLTTEQGQRGSQALGTVQNEVREDIRDADIRAEGRTIRCGLLKPLVEGKFGPDAPVPHFRRRVDEAKDPEALTRVVASAVNELGLPVSKSWYAAEAGIVITEKAEDTIQPRPAPVVQGPEVGGQGPAAKDAKDE